MRKLILLVTLSGLAIISPLIVAQILQPIFQGGAHCCSYYVSNTGSDSANGKTPATAWQTIAKVNSQSLTAGQSVGFQAGGTWRETLTVPASSISFGAYGSGVDPVIDAANLVTGWTQGAPTLPTSEWQLCGDTSSVSGCVPTSSTVAYDATASGNTATWIGTQSGTNFWYSAGHYTSYAGAFNGSNDQLTTASSIATAPQVFSISAWFKTTSASAGVIVEFFSNNSCVSSSGSKDRIVYLNGAGNLLLATYTGSVNSIVSPRSYNDGNWHQVVATLSSTGEALYVDGVGPVVSNSTPGANSGSGYWCLGGPDSAGFPGGSNPTLFTGLINDIRIYSGTALSASQVAALYAGTNPAAVWYSTVTTQPSYVIINGAVGVLGTSPSLTAVGQWYWTANTLYVYSGGSAPTNVEIPARQYAVDTNGKNHVSISALTLTGAISHDFYCRGSQYCVVQNSNLINSQFAGFEADGTTGHNTVANCQIYGWGQHGIQSQAVGDAGGNVYTKNNIYGGSLLPVVGTGDSEAIEITASNDTITNNVVHDSAALGTQGLNDGISIGGSGYQLTGVTISGNTVYNMPRGSCIWFGNASGTISSNSATNCSQGGIQLWSDASNAKTVAVTYNILASNYTGFEIGGSAGQGLYTLTFYNNTLWYNIRTVLSIYTQDFDMEYNLTSLSMENNILDGQDVVNNTHNEVAWNASQTHAPVIDYNMHTFSLYTGITQAAWLAAGYDAHGWQLTNPLLTNPAAGDFTIPTNSPAYHAGVCIAGVTACPVNVGAK